MQMTKIQAALRMGCILFGVKMPGGTIVLSIEKRGQTMVNGTASTIADAMKTANDGLDIIGLTVEG